MTLGQSALTVWCGVAIVINMTSGTNITIPITLANCTVLKSLKSLGDVRDLRILSLHFSTLYIRQEITTVT
jgi:hypothetical protein